MAERKGRRWGRDSPINWIQTSPTFPFSATLAVTRLNQYLPLGFTGSSGCHASHPPLSSSTQSTAVGLIKRAAVVEQHQYSSSIGCLVGEEQRAEQREEDGGWESRSIGIVGTEWWLSSCLRKIWKSFDIMWSCGNFNLISTPFVVCFSSSSSSLAVLVAVTVCLLVGWLAPGELLALMNPHHRKQFQGMKNSRPQRRRRRIFFLLQPPLTWLHYEFAK